MQLTLPRALPRQVTGPVVAVLARVGVTPNMLTVAQLAGGIAAGYVIARGELVIGAAVLLASATLDAFDGALARRTGKASKFGAVFDSTIDRLFEGAIFAGVLYYYMDRGAKLEGMLALVAVVGSLCVSYVRARAEGEGVELYDGIFTRFVRIMVLTVGLVTGVLEYAVGLLAVATVLTTFHRLFAVWQRTLGSRGVSDDGREPAAEEADAVRDRELEFLRRRLPELSAKYHGQWICVQGDTIVSRGATELEADTYAREAGITVPFVVRVPEPADLPFIGAL